MHDAMHSRAVIGKGVALQTRRGRRGRVRTSVFRTTTHRKQRHMNAYRQESGTARVQQAKVVSSVRIQRQERPRTEHDEAALSGNQASSGGSGMAAHCPIWTMRINTLAALDSTTATTIQAADKQWPLLLELPSSTFREDYEISSTTIF